MPNRNLKNKKKALVTENDELKSELGGMVDSQALDEQKKKAEQDLNELKKRLQDEIDNRTKVETSQKSLQKTIRRSQSSK